MPLGYSDLEVAAPPRLSTAVSGTSGPEVVKDHSTGLIVESNDTHKVVSAYYYDPNNKNHPPPYPGKNERVCGAERRTFYIGVAIIMVVILAAVVGGVVGGIVTRKSSSSPSTSAGTESTPSSTPSSSPSSSPSGTSLASTGTTPSPATTTPSFTISTTTLIGPSATLIRDCPSANDTIYDITYGSAPPMSFRKICNANFRTVKRPAGVGDNSVNAHTNSLNECIDLCASYDTRNKTRITQGKDFVCNAVCWINSLAEKQPGQCFGFTTKNDTGGFTLDMTPDVVKCDTAAWINQGYGEGV
ncbi:hypothetical protein BCR34DRAFT_596905 [Clohesyomyces aquaticus]|uniref:Apple domain-containing protein n=1 Tax=Clohesyomyces aquaticus TaxID=1231657 RepID=A0A1Y2A516_9PLEO|nr:hypothetical protein BCR34DRAFT_596905 [Clohesyomyces aquaticus]